MTGPSALRIWLRKSETSESDALFSATLAVVQTASGSVPLQQPTNCARGRAAVGGGAVAVAVAARQGVGQGGGAPRSSWAAAAS